MPRILVIEVLVRNIFLLFLKFTRFIVYLKCWLFDDAAVLIGTAKANPYPQVAEDHRIGLCMFSQKNSSAHDQSLTGTVTLAGDIARETSPLFHSLYSSSSSVLVALVSKSIQSSKLFFLANSFMDTFDSPFEQFEADMESPLRIAHVCMKLNCTKLLLSRHYDLSHMSKCCFKGPRTHVRWKLVLVHSGVFWK